MRSSVTSLTLPMAAAIGGDGIGARVHVDRNAEGVFFLDLYFDDEAAAAPVGDLGDLVGDLATSARHQAAEVLRTIDPSWLRAEVDAAIAGQGLAGDPFAASLAIIADFLDNPAGASS